MERETFLESVQCSCNLGRGRHYIPWVKSLIDRRYSTTGLSYTADLSLDAFKEGLVTFLGSLDHRPDGVVLHSTLNVKVRKLPLFILEMDLSPYVDNMAKTAIDVIDQL